MAVSQPSAIGPITPATSKARRRASRNSSILVPPDDVVERRRGLVALLAQQPARVAGEQLERGARHPRVVEGVGVVVGLVTVEQPRQVGLERGEEPLEGVVGRAPGQVAAEQLAGGAAQRRPGERGPASKRTSSTYGGRAVSVEGGPKSAVEVLPGQLEVAGVVEVAEHLGVQVDGLDDERALHVVLPVVRRHDVGQVEGVDLGDQCLADGQPGRRLLGQGPVGLHLVEVEPVEREQVLGGRLEERPLVDLEVHRGRAGQHGLRLVPGGRDQLDQAVGVAVGLLVGALAVVQRVRAVASPGRGRAG